MKILRIKFDNIIIFNEPFDIDFTASDRIMKDNGVYSVWGPINTQQTISIIGINATGKTTSIKLLNLAMEVVLNHKGLNEGNLIPSVFLNEETKKDGIVMTVYFYKDDKVFKLESKIKYKENIEGKVYFYYDDEVLKSKAKSNVTSKKNIFDFTENENYVEKRRSKLDKKALEMLKDDDSIVITATRDSGVTVNTMLEGIEDKINPVQGMVDESVLNVFDENLKRLEKIKGEDGINIEFKNSGVEMHLPIIGLEEIISSGTIKGQKIIRNAMIALKSGGYLIIDELENHLNKELVKMIINIFNNKEINKKGACLIFTTHYAEILDSFDRMDNIYVLVRNENYFTEIHRYSKVIKRSELKKSDVILSNYIKGTAPKAVNIKELEEYICKNI